MNLGEAQAQRVDQALVESASNVIVLPVAIAVSARLNVPVFPCLPNTKKPLTDHGFKNATYDPHQIIEWWKKWPDALIGMPTGKTSDYVVVDIDQKNGKDGGGCLNTLEKEYRKLPNTIETLTPSGGIHKWFKYSGEKIQSSISKIGDGLDIRGDGGYVIIPPSNGYEWEISNPYEAAEMPEWLINLCNKPKDKKKKKKSVRKFEYSELVKRIKQKDGYYKKLSPVTDVSLPEGRYPAVFVGWQTITPGKFILKKGQLRIRLRFEVNTGSYQYMIHAYRTVNILHDGRMSAGSSNQLAQDLSAIAGRYDDGFPVQIDLDDINLNLFAGKRLIVSVENTKNLRIKVNGKWKFAKATLSYTCIRSISLQEGTTY